MLSRTAESLFWITRYMERAEMMARLLDVGYRIALLPGTGEANRSEWDAILAASGTAAAYRERYGEPNQSDIETYLFFDRDNPSSVASCLERARDNGRIVRTALTAEVWYALNTAFQELRSKGARGRAVADIPDLCDWTRRVAAEVRGAIENSQLRQDGYDFLSLGYHLERTDNTARLLDVKYYVLLPVTDRIGGSRDTYQWTTLLRALSAYRAFHWSYGGDYTPTKIAHFLIQNTTCPRSLLFCASAVVHHLDRLATAYGTPNEAQGLARAAEARLKSASIDSVISGGLHEFLTDAISANAALTRAISSSFQFGVN